MSFAVQHYISSPSMVSGKEKSIWNLEHPIQFTVCRLDQFDWDNDLGFLSNDGNWFRGGPKKSPTMSWRDINGTYTNTDTLNNLYISNIETITTKKNSDMEEEGNVTIAPIGVCKYYKGLPRNLLRDNGAWKNAKTIYVSDMSSRYRIFVSDPKVAPKFVLPMPLLTGNIMEALPDNKSLVFYYKVIIKEIQIKLEDGSCTNYPDEHGHESYDKCIEMENRKIIMPVLGCMPPWLSDRLLFVYLLLSPHFINTE